MQNEWIRYTRNKESMEIYRKLIRKYYSSERNPLAVTAIENQSKIKWAENEGNTFQKGIATQDKQNP